MEDTNTYSERRVSRQSFANLKGTVKANNRKVLIMGGLIGCVVVAAFGVNVAAIDLTKEVKSTNGVMLDANTNVVAKTGMALEKIPITGDTTLEALASVNYITYWTGGNSEAMVKVNAIQRKDCDDCSVSSSQLIVTTASGEVRTIKDNYFVQGGGYPYAFVNSASVGTDKCMGACGGGGGGGGGGGPDGPGDCPDWEMHEKQGCNNGFGHCSQCAATVTHCMNQINFSSQCATDVHLCICAEKAVDNCVKASMDYIKKCCFEADPDADQCVLARFHCNVACDQDDITSGADCEPNKCTHTCGTCGSETRPGSGDGGIQKPDCNDPSGGKAKENCELCQTNTFSPWNPDWKPCAFLEEAEGGSEGGAGGGGSGGPENGGR